MLVLNAVTQLNGKKVPSLLWTLDEVRVLNAVIQQNTNLIPNEPELLDVMLVLNVEIQQNENFFPNEPIHLDDFLILSAAIRQNENLPLNGLRLQGETLVPNAVNEYRVLYELKRQDGNLVLIETRCCDELSFLKDENSILHGRKLQG